MKKLISILLLFILFIPVFSQSDTTLYCSKLGRIVSGKDNPAYSINVKRQNDSLFIQTEKSLGSKEYEQKIEIIKVTDSTFKVVSNTLKYSYIRLFSKVDSGFLIKEIRGNYLDIGFSKLVFPLIKCGTWLRYKNKDTLKFKFSEEYYVNNEMTGNKNWNEDGTPYLSDVFIQTETPIDYDNGNFNNVPKILSKYLKYPEDAAKNGIEGRVIVQFVVMENGTIDGIRIIRGVHESLDHEAIRALKQLPPKWNPGTIKGKPVKAFAVMPVIFKLE